MKWIVTLLAACASAGTLYDQSIARLLHREFAATTYLLLDNNGDSIAIRWPDADTPVPVGSLVKPLLAVASSKTDGMAAAIGESSNPYFLQLASTLRREDLKPLLTSLGLPMPPEDAGPDVLIGLTNRWRIAPSALARAYRKLPDYSPEVTDGLRRSAANGTARGIGPRALAKTGTAPCIHTPRSPGDGYVIAMFDGYTLMVQVHGAPGSSAAEVAGRMVRRIREGK